ncbi:MAG: phage tail tube protein [Rhodospirillum sp.]|nr:phage tail tube protein [Rhodospirillum sp.]MCF8500181.1 phage tail tube protein [Rhodospirillum sp.]
MSVLGVADIRVNGTSTGSLPGAEMTMGGWVPKSRDGHGHLGHSESYVGGKVTMTIMLRDGDSLDTWRKARAATVVFTADTGQVYSSASMAVTEAITVKDGPDSEVKLTFEGAHFEEIGA